MSRWLDRLSGIISPTEAALLDAAIGAPIAEIELDRVLSTLGRDYNDATWETELKPRLDQLYRAVVEEAHHAIMLVGRMRCCGEAKVAING
jgi:hypothetical protein